jgi:hypothetical protein
MAISVLPTAPKGQRFPVALIVLVIVAILFGTIALLFFLRPEVAPPTALLDKFLPQGSAIREIETINLDVEGVTSHPVFRTLREFGPVPLRIPATGKSNPFL